MNGCFAPPSAARIEGEGVDDQGPDEAPAAHGRDPRAVAPWGRDPRSKATRLGASGADFDDLLRNRTSDSEQRAIHRYRYEQSLLPPPPGAAPGAAPPPPEPRLEPPPQRFRLAEKWYVVVEDRLEADVTTGVWICSHRLAWAPPVPPVLAGPERAAAEAALNAANAASAYGQHRPFPLPPLVEPAPAPLPPVLVVDPEAPVPPPDPRYCVEGVHYWVRATNHFTRVGGKGLAKRMHDAHTKDFAFAERMQGLLNVRQNVVWDCLDPDYAEQDRASQMSQYSNQFMQSAFEGADAVNADGAAGVSAKTIYMHRLWEEEWGRQHRKGLTPYLLGPAEALVNDFFEKIKQLCPCKFDVTPRKLTFLLLRDPRTSSEFSVCLRAYMTNLDQTRAGRNASYKVMNQNYLAGMTAYKRLGKYLLKELDHVRKELAGVVDELDTRVVDWYAIAAQMHRERPDPSGAASIGQWVRRVRQSVLPPWRMGG